MTLIKDKAFVHGEWVDALLGDVFGVFNPATGAHICDVPNMGKDDTKKAIDAAFQSFEAWANLLPLERSDILRAWADEIDNHATALSEVLTMEQGKLLTESLSEIKSSSATIRWCAEQGRRLYGQYIEGAKTGSKILISRHPIGVVGAITPWNFPSSMITRKVGPALAAGCTVVLKPSEETPLTALALAHLSQKAGLPKGVLNVVTTNNAKEVGQALADDHRVRKISFTGSTAVGRILIRQSAQNVQKLSLELGGNAPFIVFPSADLEKAVEGAIASKFRNAGQTCICANRIYIHDEIFNQYLDLFLHKVRGFIVGNGADSSVSMGPLINTKAVAKVEKMTQDAIQKGAILHLGGKRHDLSGGYFEPTVLTNVSPDCEIAVEEIFGPVACLNRFKTENEVVEAANATSYGLASYIYSQDMGQVWRVSDRLNFGMVGVNEPFLANDLAPFGGIKQSGIGVEGGEYGLMEFTNLKTRVFGGI